MTDNTTLNLGSGGDVYRSKDRSGIKTPPGLIDFGGATENWVSDNNGLPTFTCGADVTVTPTVTASTYAVNQPFGGLLTFASVLRPVSFVGTIQSITLRFKGSLQVIPLNVCLFTASPAATYADHTTPTWNAADEALQIGEYQLTAPISALGTQTIYNLDGIGKFVVGASQSLYAVVVPTGTSVAPGSTSDFSMRLAVTW